ncbi:MAG: methionine adenosyltransferase, partial [Firmicutes bacterium]|nr:methionine adenosyltransferase [Bacillota bacterium]
TPELMPLPIMLAHGLTARLTEVRKSGEIKYLRPDGKAQVTVAYNKKGVPKYVDTVVVSCQHSDTAEHERIVKDITAKVIKKIIPSKYLKADTKIYINPTGRFVIGGPAGDCGVTGRKIIVDTYGGICPHGGGAFSGKDPTKVDRSAAYFSRYVCKNLVAAGVADRVMMQVAYAIGRADPVSIYIDTFGTAKYPEDRILDIVKKCFDFRPFKIIEKLELRKPIYAKTTNYGHFGKADMTWERVDMVDKLKGVLCE